MSLKVIYFQSIFLIDFYIKKTDLYAGIWNNFTKLLCSREFKRKINCSKKEQNVAEQYLYNWLKEVAAREAQKD